MTVTMTALLVTAGMATIADLRTRKIPNSLTASIAGTGVLLAATGWHDVALTSALLGLLVGAALLAPGYLLGATGAGDVKLLAAVGAWLGPALVVRVFLYSAIAGGALATIVAFRRRQLAASLRAAARCARAPEEMRRDFSTADPCRRFAYGPAIAFATALTALGL